MWITYFISMLFPNMAFYDIIIHSIKDDWGDRDAMGRDRPLESDDPGLECGLSVITPCFVKSSAQWFSTAGGKWMLLF